MSSSAGPSRVSRPRRSSSATSNGSTASSTGTDDGARTGASVVIFVSDCESMALYLGSEHAKRKGLKSGENYLHTSSLLPQGRQQLRHFVKTPRQYAFLRVQAVFSLVEHHRLRAVDHLVRDLFAAMG